MKTSEKIYQLNSYLTELEANVISCTAKDDLYEVILDKTIFYPHMSGGQPKDEGTINDIKVENVIENGDEIIHILTHPVQGSVKLSIDFKTRFDYMQQHTGQHILSCAFGNLYNANTIGFHLSSDYTTIDLDISVLTDEMIEKAEIYSNNIIYDNTNICIETLPYDEALKLNLRKTPPKLDALRITQIADKDTIACGGTHVAKTGEVGIIKVTKIEKYKSGYRVEFLCGERALKDYMVKTNTLTKLASMLSIGSHMILDSIDKIKTENKNSSRQIAALQSQLNEYKAKELTDNAQIINGTKFVFEKFKDIDVKDLRFLCTKITEQNSCAVVLLSNTNTTCSLCISQSANLDFDIKTIYSQCSAIINAKGGGNNRIMQGSGNLTDKSDQCIELAKNLFIQ